MLLVGIDYRRRETLMVPALSTITVSAVTSSIEWRHYLLLKLSVRLLESITCREDKAYPGLVLLQATMMVINTYIY